MLGLPAATLHGGREYLLRRHILRKLARRKLGFPSDLTADLTVWFCQQGLLVLLV